MCPAWRSEAWNVERRIFNDGELAMQAVQLRMGGMGMMGMMWWAGGGSSGRWEEGSGKGWQSQQEGGRRNGWRSQREEWELWG
ncbi:MAG: hypothetical protein PF692_07520 [Kiritimatiellae bacterium]|nr:hypothetical protein [Kiritimatiellia bacterium]